MAQLLEMALHRTAEEGSSAILSITHTGWIRRLFSYELEEKIRVTEERTQYNVANF